MTPLAILVEPLRQHAMNAAAVRFNQVCAGVFKQLADHDWAINKAYPYPHGHMSRAQYAEAKRDHNLAASLTRVVGNPVRRFSDPLIVEADGAKQSKLIDEVRAMASSSFDAFVAKLEGKVGPYSSCAFLAEGTWNNSVIEFQTPEGPARWKTQCILNISKLGLVFNQWPTRRVK